MVLVLVLVLVLGPPQAGTVVGGAGDADVDAGLDDAADGGGGVGDGGSVGPASPAAVAVTVGG